MVALIEANHGTLPRELSADPGYCSEANLEALSKLLKAMIGDDGVHELLLGCLDALVRALCRPWRLWLLYQPNAPAARERSDRAVGGFGYSRRHTLLRATGS